MRWLGLCVFSLVIGGSGCASEPDGPEQTGSTGGDTDDPVGESGPDGGTSSGSTSSPGTTGTSTTSGTTGDPVGSTGDMTTGVGDGSTGEPCVISPGELGPESLPAFEVSEAIEFQFTLNGSEPTEDFLFWYLNGEVPEGLFVSGGVLSGTVSEAGTYAITVSTEYPDPADPTCTWNLSSRSYELEIVEP